MMTRQRIFPFMLNGQFWTKREVSIESILKGEVLISVMLKLRRPKNDSLPDLHCDMKRVRFRLVGAMQQNKEYTAQWFECFWAVDDNFYLEDDRIFAREER